MRKQVYSQDRLQLTPISLVSHLGCRVGRQSAAIAPIVPPRSASRKVNPIVNRDLFLVKPSRTFRASQRPLFERNPLELKLHCHDESREEGRKEKRKRGATAFFIRVISRATHRPQTAPPSFRRFLHSLAWRRRSFADQRDNDREPSNAIARISVPANYRAPPRIRPTIDWPDRLTTATPPGRITGGGGRPSLAELPGPAGKARDDRSSKRGTRERTKIAPTRVPLPSPPP